MSRRSAIADPGGRTEEADEEGTEAEEEEDGGAGDTAEAAVVAVLTLGWRRSRGTCLLLLSLSEGSARDLYYVSVDNSEI